MNAHIQRLACCGAVLIVLAGCSKTVAIKEPDAFPFVQCKVQMAGNDVEGAIVQFHAKDSKSIEILGVYDSESNYYRFVTKDGSIKMAGVPDGDYAVTVKPGRQTKVKIPAKYADAAKSGLTAHIEPGKNFLPPFELTP